MFKFELQKKQIEKQNAKRICCFLQNRACDEYNRIIQAHKDRIKNTFGKEASNIIDIFQKEYDNLLKLMNSFKN